MWYHRKSDQCSTFLLTLNKHLFSKIVRESDQRGHLRHGIFFNKPRIFLSQGLFRSLEPWDFKLKCLLIRLFYYLASVLVMEPLNFWDPYYAIISSLTVFSFPHCKTRLGFPRVHLPIVYLRYTLHVFYYMVKNMLALTIFLILFFFCLNLFCLALCIWLKGEK